MGGKKKKGGKKGKKKGGGEFGLSVEESNAVLEVERNALQARIINENMELTIQNPIIISFAHQILIMKLKIPHSLVL